LERQIPIPELSIDAEAVTAYLTRRLREYVVDYAGRRGGVIGLSGGIDSATTTYLAVRSLGRENVYVYALPTSATPAGDLKDVERIVAELDIPPPNFGVIDIEAAVDGLARMVGSEDRVVRGNIAARTRMIILHAKAAMHNCLVIGTSDKSELTIGYFTKYGDAGVDLMPIADLYKTQVRYLAKHLWVPGDIVRKPPSPGLWPGQTAEEELGIPYELLDSILYLRFDAWLNEEEVASRLGIDLSLVRRVVSMVKATQHKRQLPEIFRLSQRSHGSDWRYPREWR
jgi:NAD+ synthase